MRLLAIETSCDETAVCIMEVTGEGPALRFRVLGNALFSQVKMHEQYGGVFPNVAKREHQKNLVPLLERALQEVEMVRTGTSPTEAALAVLERETELVPLFERFIKSHARPDIDAIAVTYGPGLEPALWVGISFAKALSIAWDIPLVPVNHMEGHIFMSMVQQTGGVREQVSGVGGSDAGTWNLQPVTFPVLSLLISGGHTELVLSRESMHYELLGQTRDDAVGEAFDKVARLLGLPYPGGPEVSKLASSARTERLAHSVTLPRPMLTTTDYDYSFSGLKTAVRRVIELHHPITDDFKRHICREFEDACADVLIAKTLRAIDEYDVKTVVVGGGVSANTHIRASLASALERMETPATLLIPPPAFATDNAIMIALAGYFRAQKKEFANADAIHAEGNAKLARKN